MPHPNQLLPPNPAFRGFNVAWPELDPQSYQLLAQPCPPRVRFITLRVTIDNLVKAGTSVRVALKLLQLWATDPIPRKRLRRLILSTRQEYVMSFTSQQLTPAPTVGKENLLLNHIHEYHPALFTIDDLEQSAKEALNMNQKAIRRSFTNLHKHGKVATVVEPSVHHAGIYVSKLVFGQLDFARHLHTHFADQTFTINEIVASCAQAGTPLTPGTARTYMTYLFKRGELHRGALDVNGHETFTLTPPVVRIYKPRQRLAAEDFHAYLFTRYGYWPFESWAHQLAKDYGKVSVRTMADYLAILREQNQLRVEASGARNAKTIYRVMPPDQSTPPEVQAEIDRLLSLPSPLAARAYDVLKRQFGTDTLFAASYAQLSKLLAAHKNSVIAVLEELQARGYLWREPYGGGTQQPTKYMLFEL